MGKGSLRKALREFNWGRPIPEVAGTVRLGEVEGGSFAASHVDEATPFPTQTASSGVGWIDESKLTWVPGFQGKDLEAVRESVRAALAHIDESLLNQSKDGGCPGVQVDGLVDDGVPEHWQSIDATEPCRDADPFSEERLTRDATLLAAAITTVTGAAVTVDEALAIQAVRSAMSSVTCRGSTDLAINCLSTLNSRHDARYNWPPDEEGHPA